MNITLTNLEIEGKTLNQIKDMARRLLGKEILVLHRQERGVNIEYNQPKRDRVVDNMDRFMMTENSNGVRETFSYVDVLCKDIVVHEIEN